VGGWGLVDVTCERSVSGVRRGVLGGGWRGCGRAEWKERYGRSRDSEKGLERFERHVEAWKVDSSQELIR